MTLEALLAYAHFLSILGLVVFLAAEAALCRTEWLNEAVVRRLGRLDLLYGVFALLVLASGLARTFWGMKGSDWYWSQPLLHLKLTLFVVIGLISIPPTLAFRRWRRTLDAGQGLPDAQAVQRVRRLVMIESHLLVLLPLAAVFLARGFGR